MPESKSKEPKVPFSVDPGTFSAALFLAAQGEYEAAGRVLAEAIEKMLAPYKRKSRK